ncbi:MAG: hypothetical protein JST04_05060 [Bdellovibrionales bacterium]|nr:hypothetical protein [Bdellovibrionales bacterium]
MKTTSLLAVLFALVAQGASADTCTAIEKNGNALLKDRAARLDYFNKAYRDAYAPFCQGFRIATQCNAITRLIESDPYIKAYDDAVLPQIQSAIRSSDMNGREADAFIGLVSAMRSAHYTAKIDNDEAAKVVVQMNAQGCGAILETLKLTDTALLANSAQGKLGKCKVVAGKDKGATVYKITVGGEDYPIAGVTYPAIPEVTKALRDAIDAGSCR